MKKAISFVFAMVSTMFLFAGATRAAEKFDSIASGPTSTSTIAVGELPPTPCVVGVPDET